MQTVCGVVAEYNPFTGGHRHHLRRSLQLLGEDTAVAVVMSGTAVQRGAFAILPKHVRAGLALDGGADLVLELPSRCALQSAEGFAASAVGLLAATGVVTHLSYGAEHDDAAAHRALARQLLEPGFQEQVRRHLRSGVSYPRARALALPSELLRHPNDLLAVEYHKALLRLNSGIQPVAVRREGGQHDQPGGTLPSASNLRADMRTRGEGVPPLPDVMALGVLRRLSEADWAGFPDVTEGLEHRLYRAAQTARSLAELHEKVKTKRYTLSRIRRIVLRGFLSLGGSDNAPQYLRVLGFNDTGAALLRRIRSTAALPVLTRPAAHKELLREEASVTAQYELLCLGTPYEQDAGSEWRLGAVRR